MSVGYKTSLNIKIRDDLVDFVDLDKEVRGIPTRVAYVERLIEKQSIERGFFEKLLEAIPNMKTKAKLQKMIFDFSNF